METKDLLLEFKYKKLIEYLKKLLEEKSFIQRDEIEFIIDFLEGDEKDELN